MQENLNCPLLREVVFAFYFEMVFTKSKFSDFRNHCVHLMEFSEANFPLLYI